MRTTSLVLLALASVCPIFADEASKQAKCEELVMLVDVSRNFRQMFEQMAKTAVPVQNVPTEKQAEIMRRMGDVMARAMDRMKPVMVKAYMATYNEDEITGILNFYKSPAGRAMVEKAPQMMPMIMTEMPRVMQDVQAEIKKIADEQKQQDQKK